MIRSPGNWSVESRRAAGEGFAVLSDHDFEGAPRTTHRRYVAQLMNEDDAAFMAAAPAMFEALDAIVSKLMPAAQTNHLNADFKPLYEQAKCALKKARGE